MRRFMPIAVALCICAALMTPAEAGRTDGPTFVTVYVPAGQTVYYDIPFNAGEPAIASIRGAGRSMMQINMYDADGNIAIGTGEWDRMTARMDVYRAGLFRVEIINIGAQDNFVVFTTN